MPELGVQQEGTVGTATAAATSQQYSKSLLLEEIYTPIWKRLIKKAKGSALMHTYRKPGHVFKKSVVWSSEALGIYEGGAVSQ